MKFSFWRVGGGGEVGRGDHSAELGLHHQLCTNYETDNATWGRIEEKVHARRSVPRVSLSILPSPTQNQSCGFAPHCLLTFFQSCVFRHDVCDCRTFHVVPSLTFVCACAFQTSTNARRTRRSAGSLECASTSLRATRVSAAQGTGLPTRPTRPRPASVSCFLTSRVEFVSRVRPVSRVTSRVSLVSVDIRCPGPTGHVTWLHVTCVHIMGDGFLPGKIPLLVSFTCDWG